MKQGNKNAVARNGGFANPNVVFTGGVDDRWMARYSNRGREFATARSKFIEKKGGFLVGFRCVLRKVFGCHSAANRIRAASDR